MDRIEEKLLRTKSVLRRCVPDMAIILSSYDIAVDEEYDEYAYITEQDGRRIIVLGKAWLEDEDSNFCAAVLVHEVAHGINKHLDRMKMISKQGEVNQLAYNIATDAVINRWIRKKISEKIPDWDSWIKQNFGFDSRTMTAEEIYFKLVNKIRNRSDASSGNGKGKESKKSIRDRDNDLVDGMKASKRKKQYKVIERAKYDRSEKVIKEAVKKIQQEIMQQNSDAGTGEGKAKEFKEEKEDEVWKQLYSYLFKQFIDRSFLRPSRRHPDLMGRVRRVERKSITVAVDTSRSVQGEELARFKYIVNKLAQKARAEVTVISWSSRTSGYIVRKYKNKVDEIPNIDGGTEFITVLNAVENEDIRGKVLVVFTDGGIAEDKSAAEEIVRRLKRRFDKVILVTIDRVIEGDWDKVFKVGSRGW